MLEKIKRIKAVKTLHNKLRMCSIKRGIKKYSFIYYLIKLWDIDVTDQYSNLKIDTEYLKLNVRAMHSFQLSLIDRAFLYLNLIDEKFKREIKIMDFGDSSGTHCQYIKKLYPYHNIKTLSVNIDSKAIDRIDVKGLPVMQIAEELNYNALTKRDVVMSFQVLEHLENPIKALRNLSIITDKLVLTVPYVKQSKIGIQDFKNINPENTHIYELSPTDWKKLFRYTGWKVKIEEIYYQYPRGDRKSVV